MKKLFWLFWLLLLSSAVFAQSTHKLAATDTNNTWTGTNIFSEEISVGDADTPANGTIVVTNSAGTAAITLDGTTGITCVGVSCGPTTATALAANGTNCTAGDAATGVDAAGNAEGCFTPSGGTVKRQCTYLMDNGASVLLDTDDTNDFCTNQTGSSFTISKVVCKSDAGTPSVMIRKNGATSVLSGNLSCSTSGASTTSFASATFADNDWLDILTVAAGGTAHKYTVTVVYQ